MKRSALAILLIFTALHLVGCVPASTGGVQSSSGSTGFGLSLNTSDSPSPYAGVRLDVVVPVFDPGLPEDSDDYEKLGIWPEVRRTEAIRFASLLKDELVEINSFGDVRIAPDTAVAGDLYVLGKIEKSNGEDLKVHVRVYDVSGRRWMKRNYEHRVKEYHWQNIRNSGVDPYRPLFQQVAKDIKNLLKRKSSEDLEELRAISELQFASAFARDAFSEHLEVDNRKINLVSLPAENDPMLARTRSLRVIDAQFMDKMQSHYDDFIQSTDESYVAWQEHSMTSAKAMRESKQKATAQAILGGLLILGAAYAASENTSGDAGTSIAATAAVVGGATLLQKSFADSAEGKLHRETLTELGSSLNFELAPQVIQVEDTTVTLKGDVREQYLQWKGLLKQMYHQEGTPDVQL